VRSPSPDDICGLCDEFDVEQAAPECAALGMGRCLGREDHGFLTVHVAWDSRTCVSFRLDRANLQRKRIFIIAQRGCKS
jgi:hypothetical protein